jgi:antitoxin CptB
MSNAAPETRPRETRLRMIRYRAWHRGIRETDLILGPFADQRVETLTPAQLEDFEALLEQPDQLLYAWITGEEPAPYDVRGEVFAMIQAFRVEQGA